jgi:serine/threonine protein kinase/formylglycine-generating enzyme required for sulfatase activity
MSDSRIGKRLGQYLVTDVIAQGGMATVYRGYQENLDRQVAIKVMGQSADRQFAERFKREARAMAALQHPNILPIYDYGEDDNLLFLALQYIEHGRSLRDLVGTPLPPASALQLIQRVCEGLQYAHQRGIVHRDIKPGNILLPTDTWPMLADFGIAKLVNDGQARLTLANQVIGTAAYMAPEQATGRTIDARTDLYATGAVLYELITGQVPYDADTPMAVLAKHIYDELPPARALVPNLPAPVEALIRQALEKDPAKRFQSAADMAAAIGEVSGQLTLHTQRDTLYDTAVKSFEQARWDAAIAQFDRLLALDPEYPDARDLREAAVEAQQKARATAQQGIAQIRQRQQTSSSFPASDAASTPPVAATSPLGSAPLAAGQAQNTPAAPNGQPITRTAPITPPAPSTQPHPRHSRLLPPLIVGLVALVALVGVVFWQLSRSGGTAATPTAAPQPTSAGVGVAQAGNPTSVPSAAPAPTTAASKPEPIPEPLGQQVNSDDFNDLNRLDPNGLADLRGAKDFERGFHAPGVFHMKLPNPNDTEAVLMPRQIYANFSVQSVMWDNSDTSVGSVSQGMVFRASDASHYYALMIDPRTGQYSLRRQDGPGQTSDLIPWTPSPLINQGKEKNTLRVDANGHTLSFYLNGSQLATHDDDAYEQGMIGMVVANIDAEAPHMHFDDLQIWSTDQPPAAPALPAERKDPNGDMVLIPGGAFVIGSNFNPHEPPQMLTVPDFYLDRNEVTNAQYRACVEAKACTPLSTIKSQNHPEYATQPEFDNYPVIYVTWKQATTFCGWAGKRLPTEAEWEKAASWNGAKREKTVWPWEGEFNAKLLNSDESGLGDTAAVGSYPAELNGTFDMAGNVREWTSTIYKDYPYNASDGREDQDAPGSRVFRGGSWAQTGGKARAFVRDEGAQPDVPFNEVGFRCVASAQ